MAQGFLIKWCQTYIRKERTDSSFKAITYNGAEFRNQAEAAGKAGGYLWGCAAPFWTLMLMQTACLCRYVGHVTMGVLFLEF